MCAVERTPATNPAISPARTRHPSASVDGDVGRTTQDGMPATDVPANLPLASHKENPRSASDDTARDRRAGSSDPLGSIGWTERTGGVLTARECLTLARPLLRDELGIVAGLLAMALRMHSGRRSYHRSGAPGASRLVSGKRRRGGRRRTS